MIKKIIAITVIIATLVFAVFNIIKGNVDILSHFANKNNFFIIILIVIVFGVLVNISAFCYNMLLKYVSINDFDKRRMHKSYVYSNIAKYVPGNMMHYIGRNILGKKLGIEHSDIVLASLIELILTLVSVLILCFFLAKSYLVLLVERVKLDSPVYFLLLVIILLVFVFCIIKFKAFILKVKNILLKPRMLKIALMCLAIDCVIFIFIGTTYFLVLYIVSPSNFSVNDVFITIAAFILAWVIGFVTPGAPGGLGVREAVLILILKDISSYEIILSSVILHRLLNILGDFFAIIVFKAITNIKRGTSDEINNTDPML